MSVSYPTSETDDDDDDEEEVTSDVENFLYSLLHHDLNPDIPVTAHDLNISAVAPGRVDGGGELESAAEDIPLNERQNAGGSDEASTSKNEKCIFAQQDTSISRSTDVQDYQSKQGDKASSSNSDVAKKLLKKEAAVKRRLATMNLSDIVKMRQSSIAELKALKRKCQLTNEERLKEVSGIKVAKKEKTKGIQIDRTPETGLFSVCSLIEDSASDATNDSDSSVDSLELSNSKRENQAKDKNVLLNISSCSKSDAAHYQKGKHKWWVDPEDLLPVNKRVKRYYNSNQQCRCDVCDMKGHDSGSCPLGAPICICCGKLGHRKAQCPRSLCHACFDTGHVERNCPMADKWRDIVCNRCGTVGHIEKNCFEKWRQFHATIDKDAERPVKAKQKRNKFVYCSNCSRRGHWYHMCRRPLTRSQLLYRPSSAFINRYDSGNVFAPPPDRPQGKVKEDAARSSGISAHVEGKSESVALKPQLSCKDRVEDSETVSQKTGRDDLGNDDFVPLRAKKKRKVQKSGSQSDTTVRERKVGGKIKNSQKVMKAADASNSQTVSKKKGNPGSCKSKTKKDFASNSSQDKQKRERAAQKTRDRRNRVTKKWMNGCTMLPMDSC